MIQDLIYILTNYGEELLKASTLTLQLTFISFSIGFLGGLIIAITRMLSTSFMRIILRVFTEVIRGTPMMVQLFFVYYALPAIGLKLDPYTASLIALGINSAVYQSEYLYSVIRSIPREQWDASLSLGLSNFNVMLYVILPQALRMAIPSLTNELIYLLKFSSIAYFITLPELVYVAKWIGAKTFAYVQVYIIVAVFYTVIAFIISEIMNRVEKKVLVPGLTIRKL